jgi:chorismate mutase
MENSNLSDDMVTAGRRLDPKNGRSLIIAGPCSAESPEQLLETANALKLSGNVDYYRAGLWKPRTSPDSFQGIGAEGLPWLKMVREETGLKIATEVGCERHVLEALKYDIDMLWIGARTVSNPFVVQEIAESLRGVDIPVLVKNPLNPDVDLWYGAINRFIKVGLKEVGAIHRGFSIWGDSIYRNPPIWKILHDLRQQMPGIVMICDPSHIAGKRSLVPLVSRRAIDEGADGLMIEVHSDPENAMSDAAQQLKPESFNEMLKDLDLDRNNKVSGGNYNIDELNQEIDMVDEMLIHALADRMELSRQIARLRRTNRIKSYKSAAIEQTADRVINLANEDGLRADFVHKLFDDIRNESRLI